MPKKTRAEKRLANIHKKYRLLNLDTPLIELPASKVKMGMENNVVRSSDNKTVGYFFTDLKKSLAIILLIITLEFSLYFASMFTYLKLF